VLHLMLGLALSCVVALLWLPLLSELLSLLGRRPTIAPPGLQSGEVPRLLFLVPAHDEELLISGCVRSLLDMVYPGIRRRVIVIADNCSDTTARLAREQGAESMERTNADLAGKPRAIAWALSQIDLRHWETLPWV